MRGTCGHVASIRLYREKPSITLYLCPGSADGTDGELIERTRRRARMYMNRYCRYVCELVLPMDAEYANGYEQWASVVGCDNADSTRSDMYSPRALCIDGDVTCYRKCSDFKGGVLVRWPCY